MCPEVRSKMQSFPGNSQVVGVTSQCNFLLFNPVCSFEDVPWDCTEGYLCGAIDRQDQVCW